MVTLYSFGPGFGVMDASPFVVKVDLYLRIAKLEYDVKAGTKYLRASPKGKLPFIKDNHQDIGDSSFIIEYLDKKYNVNMDSFLTEEQKSMAHLFTKSIEESLYWCLVYSRWVDDTVWEISKAKFFAGVPFLVKGLASSLIRKKVIKNLYGQGISRHSHQEVLSIADQTLNALSNVLGDKDYFFGDQISSFDATAYSVLCQFLVVDYDSDFNQLAKKYDNLDTFCQRIKGLYYP